MSIKINPEQLLYAYSQGIFPMAESANDSTLKWYQPSLRGQLPIKNLHISKSLLKTLKRPNHSVRVNTAFSDTMRGCAAATQERPNTWINEEIITLFCALHEQGHAHSVEVWDNANETLLGGLYGVQIGAVFCGESMFSRAPNASKVALVHLAARLWHQGFKALDTQFINDHLLQFGAYEIPHEDYADILDNNVDKHCDFNTAESTHDILQKYLDFRAL